MQTKSSHKIFIAIILLHSILQIHAQSDSLNLIAYLASDKYVDVSYALNTIIEDSLAEYIPYLEQNIFNQRRENFTEDWLLALNRLKSPNVIEIAKAYIDSASHVGFYDTLEAQLTAVAVLFNNRDYSRVQYLFDFVDRERPCLGRKAGLALTMLANVIKYDPLDSTRAKTETINISKNCSDDITGTLSIQLLHHHYGNELVDHYLDRFLNDQDSFIRWRSMEYLFEAKYPQLNDILLQRLREEPDRTNRIEIGDSLLTVFGQPRDYKAVKEWISIEQDETAKVLLNMSLEELQPHPPKTLISVLEFLDYTNSLCDTLLIYNWLSDQQFKDELQSILNTAKTNLQNGDSLACREDVKSFQDSVNFVYADSLNTEPRFVTIEGWKFLYWNAQYILDRLPEIPIVIAANIDVINPAMSLVNPGAFTMEVKGSGFNSSSVVYFNGNARATTFVSDSVLNTQILSTDVSAAGNFPVWVSDNSLNSDTLIYKVVSALPQPVRPVLECVTNNGDGTYTAFFGYKNENSVSVYIPVGSKNKFTPNPQDRGQTRVFKPGRQIKVYTVNFNGSNLVWTLNGRTSTASKNSAACQ